MSTPRDRRSQSTSSYQKQSSHRDARITRTQNTTYGDYDRKGAQQERMRNLVASRLVETPPTSTVPPDRATLAHTAPTAPVTTAPVTTAPVTTAPVTTAPVTTAPATLPPPPPFTAREVGVSDVGSDMRIFSIINNVLKLKSADKEKTIGDLEDIRTRMWDQINRIGTVSGSPKYIFEESRNSDFFAWHFYNSVKNTPLFQTLFKYGKGCISFTAVTINSESFCYISTSMGDAGFIHAGRLYHALTAFMDDYNAFIQSQEIGFKVLFLNNLISYLTLVTESADLLSEIDRGIRDTSTYNCAEWVLGEYLVRYVFTVHGSKAFVEGTTNTISKFLTKKEALLDVEKFKERSSEKNILQIDKANDLHIIKQGPCGYCRKHKNSQLAMFVHAQSIGDKKREEARKAKTTTHERKVESKTQSTHAERKVELKDGSTGTALLSTPFLPPTPTVSSVRAPETQGTSSASSSTTSHPTGRTQTEGTTLGSGRTSTSSSSTTLFGAPSGSFTGSTAETTSPLSVDTVLSRASRGVTFHVTLSPGASLELRTLDGSSLAVEVEPSSSSSSASSSSGAPPLRLFGTALPQPALGTAVTSVPTSLRSVRS